MDFELVKTYDLHVKRSEDYNSAALAFDDKGNFKEMYAKYLGRGTEYDLFGTSFTRKRLIDKPVSIIDYTYEQNARL